MVYIEKSIDERLGIISEIYQEKVIDENTAYLVFEVNREECDEAPERVYCILDFIDYDEDFASSIHQANKEVRERFNAHEASLPAFEIAINEILDQAKNVSPECYEVFEYWQEPKFVGVYSFTEIAEVRYGEHRYRLSVRPKEFTKSLLENSNLKNKL
ncbi:hypothetical protein [Vibrio sp. 1CM23M]|uniref:hypothetical protein n=1 Tax=Vibrio sp. 1CM23M TaxID=2929164 RepID=UPI0020BFBBBA|nr:hypothetical protein [Vibrio sp. 1CM23M]MCK8072424.1 hypothetical protein [Vibrio sp. 1CM23M]